MDAAVRQWFHKIADLSAAERGRVLGAATIEPGQRAEIESLFRFDSEESERLTECISRSAAQMLGEVEDGRLGLCGPYRLLRLLGTGGMGYLSEEGAARDPNEARSRILLGTTARELGPILAHTDPRRALTVYDHALRRLKEIQNNTQALDHEVRLLAHSASVLRRLHREGEARARMDEAFRLLRQTNLYPAERLNPDQAAAAVLQEWGDHLSETGQTQRAAQVYQELLRKIMAFGADPNNDLRVAPKVSSLYEALATADRRLGLAGEAKAVAAQRLDLWQQWDRKLPDNSYVQRQLGAASTR